MKQSDDVTPHDASEYDANIRATVPYYSCFHSETIDLVKNLRPDVETWLDTGCGTGTLVKEALAYFPDTIFVLSDPSEEMLSQARRNLAPMSKSRLQFLHPTATENLPLKDIKQPQVITAIHSHNYSDRERRQTATQRCFDILTEDGIYITFENVHPKSERGLEIGLRRWKRYQLFQGRNEDVVEEHTRRFDTAYFPVSIDDHIHLLNQCGFSVAELFWFSHMQAGFYAIK